MGKKIFVVEDDEDIRDSLIELLGGEGYEVTTAENGQIALDHLCSTPQLPDLILLDLMMPIKDGYQFCIEQALNSKIAQIPVIIMSAHGHIKEKRERINARAYLKKPVDIDEIIETVKRHCP